MASLLAPFWGANGHLTWSNSPGYVEAKWPTNAANGVGSSSITGAGAVAQNAGTANGVGQSGNAPQGTGAVTQQPNVAAGSGSPSINGTSAIVQAANVAAGAGAPLAAGSGGSVQQRNAALSAGSVDVTGSGVMQQSANTAAGIGGVSITGSGVASQAPNYGQGIGTVLSTITGVGVVVQAPNIANGSGTATMQEVPDAASAAARTYRIQPDRSAYQVSYPSIPTFLKDPEASLDFYWDWSAWLGANEDIDDWEITPAADGLSISQISSKDGIVTAWISGGTMGVDYSIACTIGTPTGRTDTRRLVVAVRLR